MLKTTNVKVAKASMEGNETTAINLLAQALSKQGDLIEKLIENQKTRPTNWTGLIYLNYGPNLRAFGLVLPSYP